MANPGWEQISQKAAGLFLARGFKEVSLREIASELGIKAASLYHHCPGGKAELYIRSVQDAMAAYRSELERAIGELPFEAALWSVAEAMVAGSALDLRRIVTVDLPAVRSAGGDPSALLAALHVGADSIRVVLLRGQREGAVRDTVDVDLATATVLAIVAGLGWPHEDSSTLVRRALTLFLDGLRAS